MLAFLVHAGILLALPPLLPGIISKTKALAAGRRGAPLLQGYRDIAKLLRKSLVLSGTTGWVFVAGPIVGAAAVALAGFLIPLGPSPAPLAFAGDMLLFAYLFGLARFFAIVAALDTGSAFEGMGSSREAFFACLTEPAILLAFLALSKRSLSLSLSGMLGAAGGWASTGSIAGAAPFVLVCLGLFVVLLAETCRLPVDDPTTHLELTMIHEAMVLDHGGPLLALVEYSSAMKLLVLESLLARLVLPLVSLPAWLGCCLSAAVALALSAAIGVLESGMARLKMRRVPYLLTGAILLCGSSFILMGAAA
jgi:formate hydrogenlyase subunit 4